MATSPARYWRDQTNLAAASRGFWHSLTMRCSLYSRASWRDRQGRRIRRCTMASKTGVTWLTEDVAEFLASCPSPEELLTFRPSARALQRYSALLARSKTGSLSTEE